MAFFTKNGGKWCRLAMLGLWLTAEARATENEINLTEAIRGEVGALHFGYYAQDMGALRQGDRLEFHIPYIEEKGAPVRILGIHQACGCLSLSLQAGQEIAKNAKGELVVRVDTTHFIGSLDKEVVILTNENRDRPHVFRLKATVERLITVSPQVVQLNGGVAKVRVKSASKQTLHIEKVVYNEDTLEVQATQVQETWELLVRWKGESAPANINETIELLTDGPVKSLKIPVVGTRSKNSRLSLSAPR